MYTEICSYERHLYKVESNNILTTTPQPVIKKYQSLFVAASSVISGVTTFIFTWLAAQTLSVEDNKEFLLFWSLTSLVFATLLGIQQESARLIGNEVNKSLHHQAPVEKTGSSSRPILSAVLLGVIFSALMLLLLPFWSAHVLEPESALVTVSLIAVGAIAYSCHVFFVGSMAGLRAWTEYSLMISLGGIFYLVGGILATFFAPKLIYFELSFIGSAFLWILFLVFSPKVRYAAKITTSLHQKQVISRMLWAILTALAMAVMSTGFPVFLEVTTKTAGTAEAAALAAIILAVSITRAPIMLPLQAFQGVAVSHFLTQKEQPIKALAKPACAILGLGAIGGALAFLVGPFLFDLIYPKYEGSVSGLTLGALTFAAALLALTTLSGTVVLALDSHKLYLSGWFLTVLISLGLLFIPGELAVRTVVSLTVGPVLGFLIHTVGLNVLIKKNRI